MCSTAETSDATVRLTKFDVTHSHHKEMLLRVDQNSNPEISLRDIGDGDVLLYAQSFCVYGLDHAWGTLSATTNVTETVLMRVKVLYAVSFAFSMKLGL